MLKMRIAIEQFIARKTVETLIAANYLISINDGEETVVKRSDDIEHIMRAMFSTDEDYLIVSSRADPKRKVGWVKFIYGNSGWDVINDHTVNLEAVLKPVLELCEIIDNGGFTIEIIPSLGTVPNIEAWNGR